MSDADDYESDEEQAVAQDADSLVCNERGGYFVPRSTHVAERKELLRRMGGVGHQAEMDNRDAVDATPPRATFDGVFNFRDLARVAPSKLRAGRIYRSGTPSEASKDDLTILLCTLNVKTIVDFRDRSEAESDPGQRLYRQHFLSDNEEDGDDIGATSEAIPSRALVASPSSISSGMSAADNDPLALHHARDLSDGGTAPAQPDSSYDDVFPADSNSPPRCRLIRTPYVPRSKMRNTLLGKMSFGKLAKVGGYFAMGLVSKRAKSAAHSEVFGVMDEMGLQGLYQTILENSGPQIAKALRVCAERCNHPILMHCSHGKDRTGLTAAIIFMLAGVPPAAIVADYHMSEPHGLSDRGRSFFARHPEMNADYWGSAPSEVMEGTMAYINTTFGSIGRYLSHIGFDQGWQRKLLSALIDP